MKVLKQVSYCTFIRIASQSSHDWFRECSNFCRNKFYNHTPHAYLVILHSDPGSRTKYYYKSSSKTSAPRISLMNSRTPNAATKPEDGSSTNESKYARPIQLPPRIPTYKKLQIQKKLATPTPTVSKDAWGKMFGSFLHDINLRNRKTDNKEETQKHLTDPLVNSAPIFVPCSSKQFKFEFYRYLEGSQTIEQLMHAINFPRIIAKDKEEEHQIEKKKGIVKKIQQFRLNRVSMKRESHGSSILSSEERLKMQQLRLVEDRRYTEAVKIQEQMRQRIQRKVQVLRDFVNSRIELRRKENQKVREEEIRNIHFIKTFFDITSDYKQQIHQKQEELEEDFEHYKKLIPAQKKLKHMLVRYDNVQPVVRHQEQHMDLHDHPSQALLKNMMSQHSKEYLQELENEKLSRFKEALTQVRKLLEAQNIRFRSKSPSNLEKVRGDSWTIDVPVASPRNSPHTSKAVPLSHFKDGVLEHKKKQNYILTKRPFYLFTKRAQNDKNPKNTRGIITMYDVRLYDYIHNQKIYSSNQQLKSISHKFHTMVESDLELLNNEKLMHQLQQRRLQTEKNKSRYALNRQLAPKHSEPTIKEYDSDDLSLQSIYEVNLDTLYTQSTQLAKKLDKHIEGGFAKRLKQLMRLEDVNRQTVQINLQKLSKTSS